MNFFKYFLSGLLLLLFGFKPEFRMAGKTRNETHVFGLGAKVTISDAEITGNKLPTNEQVLRSFRFFQEVGNGTKFHSKFEIASLVYEKIIPFYVKAGIPTLSDKRCKQKIIDLVDNNRKFRSIQIDKRNDPAVIKRLEENQILLNKTFPMWSADAEKTMTNREDIAFLTSMKTDRAASFGSFDRKLNEVAKRKEKRLDSERKRKIRSDNEVREAMKTVILSVKTVDDDSDCDSDDKEYTATPTRSHKRTKRTGSEVFIPPNILRNANVVSLATRLKISPSAQAAFTETIINECGGDIDKITTSYSSADRARTSTNKRSSERIRELWMPPKYASLHWDGKSTKSLADQYVAEERLAIGVGDKNDVKLLGTPSYKNKTDNKAGDIISNLTMGLLKLWKCAAFIVNMVFDTTSANTGHLTAACIAIQRALNRALLWSGCRHHVGEVVLKHIFEGLQIEASKSPEITVFERFRSHFDVIVIPKTMCTLDIDSFDVDTKTVIMKWKKQALERADYTVAANREDYREFGVLVKLYLGQEECISFRRPGAVHKARWMARCLYTLKMVLLEEEIAQLPKGTITAAHQSPKLKEFANFIALVYFSWWATACSTVDAPMHDLAFAKDIIEYSKVSKCVSESAQKAFSRHLWYLTSEMIPLALFSKKVPDSERESIARKMIQLKPSDELSLPRERFGSSFGKPKFPENIDAKTCLSDLVGIDSWFIFRLMDLESDFLNSPVKSWLSNESYVKSRNSVLKLNVVNDFAERSVKLSTDFIDSAKIEERYQAVLQVVEQNRKDRPNIRKKAIAK